MKTLNILYRNIKNHFSDNFGVFTTILFVTILTIFVSSFFVSTLFNYCMVILSKSDIYWWIFSYKSTPSIHDGEKKLALACLQILVTSIINITPFLFTIDYYSHGIRYCSIAFMMQNIFVLYGYFKLTLMGLILLPLSILYDIKKYTSKKVIKIVGICIIIYLICTMIHKTSNYQPIRHLIDQMVDRKIEREENEYLVTTLVCVGILSWLLVGLICVGFYIFIFSVYWYFYCVILLAETKTIEIYKLDPILPCPFDGYNLGSYEIEIMENDTKIKKKVFDMLPKWSTYRTVTSFIITGTCFLPILILISWKLGIVFLVTFPTIIEFIVRLYHVIVNTLHILISKCDSERWIV